MVKALPLGSLHESLGAKFGEFAGYDMPLYYSKPIEEHHAVRRSAGIFDISHMGQFMLEGEESGALLQHALTNDVGVMSDGEALYSPLCREDGGVLDDLIVYRYSATRYRIIVNASRRSADFGWLSGLAGGFRAELSDITERFCLFAVQGPQAFERLRGPLQHPPGELGYYGFTESSFSGRPVFMARTGYTGEQGVELAVEREEAAGLWEELTGGAALTPIGLAARDTLRLEACMALYGHELREEWNPLESGLGWAVKLDKTMDFVGRAALRQVKAAGLSHQSVGLELTGRGIPRADYPVLQNGEPVGMVTSGVLSPTTGRAIALARVKISAAKRGTPLEVEIRGKPVAAEVVRKPFYKNPHLKDPG